MAGEGLQIIGGHALVAENEAPVRADLSITDGRIASITVDSRVRSTTGRTIDATDFLIVPGLVNGHTHAHNNLARSAGDLWPHEVERQYLAAFLWGVRPDELYFAAALGAIEMLRTGCTGVVDLVRAVPNLTIDHVEAVVQAYIDSGMRCLVVPSISDRRREIPSVTLGDSDDGECEPESLLTLCRAVVDRFNGLGNGRISSGIAASAPLDCSDDLLIASSELARTLGVPFHTHLAESKSQVVTASRRWSVSMVEMLDQIGAIDSNFVGAHGVWLTPKEFGILASRGATIVHNPCSNMRLGNGVAPIRDLTDAGVAVGLGSDGTMTSDNLNMYEAMRAAALLSRLRGPNPEVWLSADEVWSMATNTSGALLGMDRGMDRALGRIEVGAKADLVLLDKAGTQLTPMLDAKCSLVFSEDGSNVDTVLVDGIAVLENREPVGLGRRHVVRGLTEASNRLKSENLNRLSQVPADARDLVQKLKSDSLVSLGIDRYAP